MNNTIIIFCTIKSSTGVRDRLIFRNFALRQNALVANWLALIIKLKFPFSQSRCTSKEGFIKACLKISNVFSHLLVQLKSTFFLIEMIMVLWFSQSYSQIDYNNLTTPKMTWIVFAVLGHGYSFTHRSFVESGEMPVSLIRCPKYSISFRKKGHLLSCSWSWICIRSP